MSALKAKADAHHWLPTATLRAFGRTFLRGGEDEAALATIRGGERTGRPLGAPAFVARLEARTGRTLAPQKPGRKPAKAEG